MEKIKDFFHNFSDIFFAIIIASIMFAVLALNLGSWFNRPVSAQLPDSTVNNIEKNNSEQSNSIIEENNENEQLQTENIKKTDNLESENNGGNKVENQQNNNIDSNVNSNEQEQENKVDKDKTDKDVETKKITVPSGTFSKGIANILKDNGLIDDANDFIKVTENLNVTNKLKAGSFEIPINATMEDIAKIIAGQ